ncbi:MAG: type II toxin-antitoxin system VapC family toxin [Cyclobacteriaceae bacterium]
MKLLLDTHTFIWFVEGDISIPPVSQRLIENTSNQCFISSVSLWEMTIKSSLGKLEMSIEIDDLSKILTDLKIEILALKIEHLKVLSSLPFHHRDPFDRLIIAQALFENMTLLSKDQKFKHYPVDLHWE